MVLIWFVYDRALAIRKDFGCVLLQLYRDYKEACY